VAMHGKQLQRWRDKKLDMETLYAQLYSYKASGFVIGASTFFGAGASTSGGISEGYAAQIAEARAKGLQFPHAYCVLEMATTPDGEELIKLRNPNGHAGWRGDWGKGSPRWTYDLKQELGIDNEDSGVFWMTWNDFGRLFAELTVCRLLPDHLEARQGGWLPSIFGAGQALTVEVFAHSRIEVALHQEPHSDRGETAISTLVDLGFVVMKQAADGALTLVTACERTLASSVCASATLEQDDFTSRYLVLPMCFGHMRSSEPRKYSLSVHSTQPITLEATPASAAMLATAAIQLALTEGECTPLLKHPMFGEVLKLYVIDSEAGYLVVGENSSQMHIRVEVDASERTTGFTSSRGALFSQDVIPPRSRQLLLALSIDMSKKAHSLSMGYGGGVVQPGEPVGGHIPDLADLGALRELHEPQPMSANEGGFPQPTAPPARTSDIDVSAALANVLSGMQQRP